MYVHALVDTVFSVIASNAFCSAVSSMQVNAYSDQPISNLFVKIRGNEIFRRRKEFTQECLAGAVLLLMLYCIISRSSQAGDFILNIFEMGR